MSNNHELVGNECMMVYKIVFVWLDSFPEHDSQKKSPVWREKKNSRDLKEQNNSTISE